MIISGECVKIHPVALKKIQDSYHEIQFFDILIFASEILGNYMTQNKKTLFESPEPVERKIWSTEQFLSELRFFEINK